MQSRSILRSIATVIVLLCLASCSSSSGPSDHDWSRSYFGNYDRVWEAAVQVLAESGFYIEQHDRERGRIRAESAAGGQYREVVLDVRVIRRTEHVEVIVRATAGAMNDRGMFKRIETLVNEFLADLDLELKA